MATDLPIKGSAGELMQADETDYTVLRYLAASVFNPNIPINSRDLFSGRRPQINRVLDVIFQRGQHAIIFGERGVGKTSFANVMADFAPEPSTEVHLLSKRINCDSDDDFASVWRKMFDELQLTKNKNGLGFNSENKNIMFTSNHFFPHKEITPNDVRKALEEISLSFFPILIIDEFDRLNKEVRHLFSDLIKSLSDYSLHATIILIGVGSSVEHLINDHQSVSRALVQIPMQRMNKSEIMEIITNGLSKLRMTISDETVHRIIQLSKGLPHYTHLVSLKAAQDAISKKRKNINNENLVEAIRESIEDSQYSIKNNYFKAINSSRKDSLFPDVLLACALVEVNEMDEFSAPDLRPPMLTVTGKQYDIPSYSQHLNEFADVKRGNILIKTGDRRCYKYKFADPLMQPYIIMRGIMDNKLSSEYLLY